MVRNLILEPDDGRDGQYLPHELVAATRRPASFTGPDKLLPWVETIGLEGWRNDVALCTRNLLINPVIANVNALLQAWINVADVDSEMVYMPRHFTSTVALVREQVFGAPFPADVLHAMTANMWGKPANFLDTWGLKALMIIVGWRKNLTSPSIMLYTWRAKCAKELVALIPWLEILREPTKVVEVAADVVTRIRPR